MAKREKIWNWGRYPQIDAYEKQISTSAEVEFIIDHTQSLAVRGCGRSYGDSSLNEVIINTLGASEIKLDAPRGIVTCGAGVIISDLLAHIVPEGFFLPVTPGTKFVSIGGAIAADIHGKNHHSEGNISTYLDSLTVQLSDKSIVVCSRDIHADLFWATCGGMGLTGVILEAVIRLKPIKTAYIRQKSIKAKNLEEVTDLLLSNQNYTYSVAWIDCLKTGKKLGRSILLLGEHAREEDLNRKQKKAPLRAGKGSKLNVPFTLPGFVLSRFTMRIFNYFFYHKQIQKETNRVLHYEPYFYPLDVIRNWNRIYGKGGFTQYQFVLPPESSKEGMRIILEKIGSSGQASFLSVLKMFGNERESNYIAFPMKGLNLALDIKLNNKTFRLLNEIDTLVQNLGGRVYLAKDSRMSRDFFEATYPELPEFKALLQKYNPKSQFSTLQSERLGLTVHQEQIVSKSLFMPTVLILGANSDIAFATSRVFASNGFRLLLAGHNLAPIEEKANRIRSEHNTEIDCLFFDARNTNEHKTFYESLPIKPDVVVCAFGTLPSEDEMRVSIEKTMENIAVNYSGAVSILTAVAADFKQRKAGSIIGISSVAGDRGRGSNYNYGAAKAGFTAWLSGLRNNLHRYNVHVATIKPGFVRTKMIEGLETPAALTASAEHVAKAIFKAYRRRRSVVYVKPVWRLVMWIIRHVPEFVFKRTSL